MKNFLFAASFIFLFSLSSCFVQTYNVGAGAQSGEEVKDKGHYLLVGIVTLDAADPTQMAGGATDYKVKNYQSFVDGLLRVVTFGIYAPTTTIVTK